MKSTTPRTPEQISGTIKVRMYVFIKALLGHYGGVSFDEWLENQA